MGLIRRHNLLAFYMEVWNRKRWIVTGDAVPPQERAFIISNHPSEVSVVSPVTLPTMEMNALCQRLYTLAVIIIKQKPVSSLVTYNRPIGCAGGPCHAEKEC